MKREYATELISCELYSDWENKLANTFQYLYEHGCKIEFCEALSWKAEIVIVYSWEVEK